MKFKTTLLCISLGYFLLFGCSGNAEIDIQNETTEAEEETETPEGGDTIKILSLGDSYTIGQSVCETCRFPEQLKASLKLKLAPDSSVALKVIAKTGWKTSNLINAIASENLANDYSLVTLLIGVNNQFQGKPFSIYEEEFSILVNTAITKARSDKSNVIVISIPDYAYTPFGKGNINISQEIDRYNNFAENYCIQNNICYIYITDITREGLDKPELVASDGLHPSTLAYSKFVERILPIALEKLKN